MTPHLVFVREPDLIVVTVTGLVIVIVFVVQELRVGKTHLKDETSSDRSHD